MEPGASDAATAGRVRRVIERLLDEGVIVARSDGTTHPVFPVAIGPEEGEALRRWIERERAARTIEVGLQVLEDAGLAQIVEHHPDEALIALPRLLGAGRRFDAAFVDGKHRFDGVFLDLVYLGRLIRPGGIVFVDDYQLPSVRHAASFCMSNLGWTLEQVSTKEPNHHWAVMRTARHPDRRPFYHFVEF